MDLKSRLAYLLNRRRDGTITDQEENELIRCLIESPDTDLTEFLREEWENSDEESPFFENNRSRQMLENILDENKSQVDQQPLQRGKHVILQRLAAAAAVLIFLSIGLYIGLKDSLNSKPEIATTKTATENLADAPPGGSKATLTLPQGRTIVLDNAANGLLAQQGNITVRKTNDGHLIYEVSGDAEHLAKDWNILATPRGGQYQILLPDGTKVWLNAASSLKFPSNFQGKTRLVELTGEAYFEVAKNPEMPFRVRSEDAEVEVLGTHFNIMAYREEEDMKTTLLEGSVKVKGKGFSDILQPGQQATVSAGGAMVVIDNVNLEEAVAWKNGLFEFNEADLPSIMREAARWYDLEVSYEGEIPQRRFTGRISRNVNASELLSILKYTGINFRIENKRVIVTN